PPRSTLFPYTTLFRSRRAMTRPEALKAMGLDDDASVAAIKRRYHELASKMHPDKGGSADQFHLLQAVYQIARSQPVPRVKGKELDRKSTRLNSSHVAI